MGGKSTPTTLVVIERDCKDICKFANFRLCGYDIFIAVISPWRLFTYHMQEQWKRHTGKNIEYNFHYIYRHLNLKKYQRITLMQMKN